jgi:hypothetical protein
MKKFIGRFFVFAFMTLLLAVCAPAPFPATGFAAQGKVDFVVKDGEWYRQSGNKTSEPPVPNGSEETETGWVYWLYADPEISDEAKGAERGFYFYSEKQDKYSFLRSGGGANVNGVHFSPDGKTFIVESTAEQSINDISLELFAYEGLASLFKTTKAATPPLWLDAGRFVYSRFEPGTDRGRSADYYNEWMSLSLYDAASGEDTVIKEATETSDFLLAGFAEDGVTVWEEYVDSPKDWADPDKAKNREITVPIPPAG